MRIRLGSERPLFSNRGVCYAGPRGGRPVLTVISIVNIVSSHYYLKPELIFVKDRTQPLAEARQVAMYFTRTLLGYSLPQIAREFNKQDHTTVCHAIRLIEGRRRDSSQFDNFLKIIEKELGTAPIKPRGPLTEALQARIVMIDKIIARMREIVNVLDRGKISGMEGAMATICEIMEDIQGKGVPFTVDFSALTEDSISCQILREQLACLRRHCGMAAELYSEIEIKEMEELLSPY